MICGNSDYTVLHNGVKMPWLGLGLYKISESDIEFSFKTAIKAGYRSFDTAAVYGNESGLGKAVKESTIQRNELFITTKVWNSDQGYDSTLKAFEESMKKLQLDYLDLYLIHWPTKGKFKDTWRALEKLYTDKRVRAIGVCNFHIHHLEDLLASCNIKPMVDQVEFHPLLTQN
jgi:diketogulonate reductase-like aldo/keto reductase